MKFIGRSFELSLLEDQYAAAGGRLIILYGRRRVGKTELLAHFCRNKPAVYFTASQTEAGDNLNEFVATTIQMIGARELSELHFRNIEGILNHLANKAKEKRLIVVLDEFQNWVAGDKSIPSIIQRFWDKTGKSSNLMLILCGSSISMMVEHTLAERSPLYGRRSGQLELKPFDYRTAAKFFPNWPVRDKLKTYGVLGGMPAYLAQFDPNRSFTENLQTHILTKGKFLSEEADFLLKTELRDTKTYLGILKAIAGGNTSLKDITSKIGMDARAIATYLSNLQTLHLLQREVSLSEPAPKKSRKGRYVLQDNFLNFWFRFVEPNLTYVEINQGSELFHKIIAPQLNTYMGMVFKSVCRQYVLLYGKEIGLPIPRRIGRIWGKDFDIDVAAESANGEYVFGECKWSSSPIGTNVAEQLKQRAAKTKLAAKKNYFVLFSAAGFKGKISNEIICADLHSIYHSKS